MEHSLNPILHVVNPKVYEGKFSPYSCGIGLSDICWDILLELKKTYLLTTIYSLYKDFQHNVL